MAVDPAHKLVLRAWGTRVRNARKALGLSQVAAAERIGIDQSALSRIENGDYRAMNPEMVLRLCLALNLDPDITFGWPPAIVEIARSREAAA